MKTSLNRRNFLKAALCSIGAVSVPFIPLIARSEHKDISRNYIKDLIALKRKAAEAFYKKEYDLSQRLYQDLIAKYPGDITCYDGLSKIFYQRADYLSAINIFTQGLQQNKENPAFYDRLAKSLVRLSLGNLKQEKQYKADNIFEESVRLYLESV